jgi:thiol-disulfide isomerase/thioredoxin
MKPICFKTFGLFLLLALTPASFAQQKAIIYSINNSDTQFKSLLEYELFPFDWLDFAPYKKISYQQNAEKQIIIDFTLNHPEPKYIDGTPEWQEIFVTPGDSIGFNIIIDNNDNPNFIEYHLEFIGKNAGNYNFMYELNKAFPHRTAPFYESNGNIVAYKDSLIMRKEKQLDFFKRYKEQHFLSKDFIDYVNAYIDDRYATFLYMPINTNTISNDSLPQSYFDEVYQLPLKDESLTNVYCYSLLYRFISFYLNEGWSLDAIYNNILNKTEGKTREYLISALIGQFADKDYQDKKYKAELLNIIQQTPQYVSDTLYTEYIRLAKNYYFLHDNPIPEDILLNTFLETFGDSTKISLKEMLNKHQGKPIYLDFWASWCVPCRYDIGLSAQAQAYLKEKDVTYIYISVDTSKKAWRVAAVQDKITENQYLIEDGIKSPLVRYWQFNRIPRYILLDKEHKVKTPKAAHPIPASLQELKEQITRL